MAERTSPQSLREKTTFHTAAHRPEMPILPWLYGIAAAVVAGLLAYFTMQQVFSGLRVEPLPVSSEVPSFSDIKPRLVGPTGGYRLSNQQKAYCIQVGKDAQKALVARVRQSRQISNLGLVEDASAVAGSAARLKCLFETMPEALCVEQASKEFASIASRATEQYGTIVSVGAMSDADLKARAQQAQQSEYGNGRTAPATADFAVLRSEVEVSVTQAEGGFEALRAVLLEVVAKGFVSIDAIRYRERQGIEWVYDRLLAGASQGNSVCV